MDEQQIEKDCPKKEKGRINESRKRLAEIISATRIGQNQSQSSLGGDQATIEGATTVVEIIEEEETTKKTSRALMADVEK